MTMFNGEPKLDDLLSDPIMIAMMRSDGVDRDRVGCILRGARRRMRQEALGRSAGAAPGAC